MKISLLLWEGLTVAVIVFGAVAVFLLRRWLTGQPGEAPPGFWMRFSVLLCGLCIILLIEGVLLSPYGFDWYFLAMAVTLYVIAKFAPKLLIR